MLRCSPALDDLGRSDQTVMSQEGALMSVRDRAVEWGTLGVAAGGTGAIVAIMFRAGFDSGDVFALAGAAIGAAVTVAGALWVAESQAGRAHDRETSIIVTECRPLRDEATGLRASLPNDDGPWPQEWREGLRELWLASQEVPALLREALEKAATLDLRERVKVRKAEGSILAFDRFYQDCFCADDELHPLDERSWGRTLENLARSLGELLDAVAAS
jgi:hypothetical protein